MKLSRDEEIFLRHWMHEELCYRDGPGPAKRLQHEHGVVAAVLPVAADQEAAALSAPAETPIWPWSRQAFHDRLLQARQLLADRATNGKGQVPRHAPNRAAAEPEGVAHPEGV